tara:strand:+ start:262 stop:585 length:324 start_codon:yes stop_codon:yes gene_type:complete
MSYTKNKNKNKNKNKRVYFNKKTKKRKQRKQTMQRKKKQRNIKLIIKDLGKKTKKYKRIQYGCKSMKGGGPLFQPFTYLSRTIENNFNSINNTIQGNDTQEYNYTNY